MTRRFARIGFLALVGLTAAGCAGVADYAKAVASDQANVCVSASSPYGGGVVGRVNTPGTRMTLSGSSCVIETPPAK